MSGEVKFVCVKMGKKKQNNKGNTVKQEKNNSLQPIYYC